MSDNFTSKIGFLLASAGSSIGLGSIWRFPYMVAENGFGSFIIMYLFSLILIGIPLVLAEYAIGVEATKKNNCLGIISIWKAHSSSSWCYLLSYIFIITSWIIYTYYMVICGWIFIYFFKSLIGGIKYSISNMEYYRYIFQNIINNNFEVVTGTFLAFILTAIIGIKGVSKGIQRLNSIGLPLLFIILLIIVCRVLTLDGAVGGIKNYFSVNINDFTLHGMLAAVGQAFYALSLGLGILSTYASYAKQDNNLLTTANNTAFIIFFVSILIGVMIIPSLFMFNFNNIGGSGLVFVALPTVFSKMYGGWFFAVLFFGLVIIAVISSTIALLEVIITVIMSALKINRIKAIIVVTFISMCVSFLQILSFNKLSYITIFGKTIFNFSDFLASSILMPIGAIITCLFLGFVLKKNVVNVLKSYEKRSYIIKFRVYEIWFFWLKYIIPFIVLWMLIASWVTTFD